MKKLMLLCAGFMLTGFIAVNAQSSDTTNRPSKATTTTSTPQESNQEESNQMTQKKDMVRVQSAEVPASLRKTLEDPMYVGWENATIWRNKNTNEYSMELMSGNTTTTYRFDKSGKP